MAQDNKTLNIRNSTAEFLMFTAAGEKLRGSSSAGVRSCQLTLEWLVGADEV